MITANNFLQLRDYLTQLSQFQPQLPYPTITFKLISEKLEVSGSTISRFLNKKIVTSLKLMRNFCVKYPLEAQRWPNNCQTINRLITIYDVAYFLYPERGLITVPIQDVAVQPPAPVLTYKRVTRITRLDNANIVITYRGHQSNKDAKGMLFDHVTFQKSTRHPTVVSLSSVDEISLKVSSLIRHEINQIPSSLRYGQMNNEGKRIPYQITQSFEGGLLFIPGRARQTENEPFRLSHEYQVIRQALNRGQPLLGICAGAWRVWEQFFIWNRCPDALDNEPTALSTWHHQNLTLIDVNDHCSSHMIRLNQKGTKACNNKMIHLVQVEEHSLLNDALNSASQQTFQVNSIHWKAVNPALTPENARISAWAKRDVSIKVKNRHQRLMEPEENTPEAFESIFGAPIMGIQWHPEGDSRGHPNNNLLRYMARAGDAYFAKRRMLHEFSNLNL